MRVEDSGWLVGACVLVGEIGKNPLAMFRWLLFGELLIDTYEVYDSIKSSRENVSACFVESLDGYVR